MSFFIILKKLDLQWLAFRVRKKLINFIVVFA